MTTKTERIRALNDQLRQLRTGGTIVVTEGVSSLGPDAVSRIFLAIATFNEFSDDNDPYGEHDFGAIEAEGERLFFKIDYYNEPLTHHSLDPSNPAETHRVMTVMLAQEY